MKNIIYIALLVLVLGGGAFYFYEMNEEKTMEEYMAKLDEGKATSTEGQNVATGTKPVATTSVNTNDAKKYTLADVSMHNKKEDCWLVINGSVLDVTSFISIHPGGDKILKGCGVDATGYFNKVPGHMKGMAQGLLNKLRIGELQN